MKIKKIHEISELKKNVDLNKKIFVIDITEQYCFICQDAETAIFFINEETYYNKNNNLLFKYVTDFLLNYEQFKKFLFDYTNFFGKNCFYLKSWFYVNGYNSLEVNDSLSYISEEFLLKDRAKISSIFFKNYNDEEKNHSFSLLNCCIPAYKSMTKIGLYVEEFDDVYYRNISKFIQHKTFHPTYNIITNTSSRIFSVLHSFPKKYKHNICARPGNKIVEFDYSAAEARIISFLCEDKKLKKNIDKDLHIENAKIIFGDIDIQEKHRQLAKEVFFGWINGINLNSISKKIDIDFSDTRSIINKLKKEYPKLISWSDKIIKETLKTKIAVNVFGRKRNFQTEISNNIQKASRQIVSFYVQSTFTDIKLAVIYTLYRKFCPYLIGEIVDSILMEFPDDENFEDNINEIIKIMENPFENRKLIMSVKANIGYNLGEKNDICD